MYQLKNIRMSQNTNTGLSENIIYAELHDSEGICITATLEYILDAIIKRRYEVEGVEIQDAKRGGLNIILDRY